MDQTQYIGENLLPGYIGHLLIVLSFCAILFAAFCFFRDLKRPDIKGLRWQTLGRTGFFIHGAGILGLIAILFYIMINQLYEYAYVYEHVSEDLPMKYIFSAFWEGQEGSFLLWMFWHIVLGSILIFTAKKWESGTMLFLCLVQAVINSMILGIHIEIGDFVYKLGSNPTLLLRDVFDAPIFNNADYLSSIKGSGLNPLLQNYWMTIHPPTLFLGFASVTIPFTFAMAGFYTRDFKAWLNPCLKWALFSGGILGVGILMGGAWAYEALTFGGYWAWDPVENMSLVPWLILVAAIHSNLISKATGRAIKTTFAYYCMSFVLILYSTYLTRSGVLGDTSVHAFTEMGLELQLILFVVLFVVLPLILFLSRRREIPVIEKEESIYSREFWMFVGALILLFSGIIIAASTSLPVLNAIIAIFDPEHTGKVIQDPIPHYNKFQIWIAFLICILSANVIYFRYKIGQWSRSNTQQFFIRNGVFLLITLGLYYLIGLWIDFYTWRYSLLAIAALFAISANGNYLINHIRKNPIMAGAAISHLGFSIMIIGVLASALNERIITTNPFVMQGLIMDEDLASSVRLIKDEPLFVNDYWITYEGDSITDRSRFFKIKFVKKDSSGIVDSFHVYPNLLFSNDLTKVAAFNPGTRRTFDHDIFTRITSLPKSQVDVKFAKEMEDTLQYEEYEVLPGDTLYTSQHYGVVEYTNFNPGHADFKNHEADMGLAVGIRFYELDGSFDKVIEPALGLKDNMLYQYAVRIDQLGLKVRLSDETFNNYFTDEDKLDYQSFTIPAGGTIEFEGRRMTLAGFNKDIEHSGGDLSPEDVAIQAVLTLEDPASEKVDTLNPIYVIRNNQPMSIKDYTIEQGIHVRLSHIDPVNELFEFKLAKDNREDPTIVFEIADRMPRSDIINLEAKIFPGINLFWLGTCLMLAGFFVAYLQRLLRKYA